MNLPLNDDPPQIINIPIGPAYAGRAYAAFSDGRCGRMRIAGAGVPAGCRHDEIPCVADASAGALFRSRKLGAARAGGSQQGRVVCLETFAVGLRENGSVRD